MGISGFLRIPAGWGRREADIVGRAVHVAIGAESGPKRDASRRTGLRTLAVIQLRARNRKTRGASSSFARVVSAFTAPASWPCTGRRARAHERQPHLEYPRRQMN